ncbi:MAG TPA: hypothetical protein VHZ95_17770, partial [Polyangiales bacterium]|nr:hypothetical protein [Polyangiales bacterium]
VSTDDFPQGVYARIPVKGIVVWNSHGFNLTKEPTQIAQYNTFWYAHPDERTYLVHSIFDTRNIFVMNVPPFQSREYCANYTLPQYSRLIELSSHTHKRGIRWRTWLPPQSTDCTPANNCTADDSPAIYESESYNDPVVMSLSPALNFDDGDDGTRTLKYCALYDNGKSDPRLVKRKSMLPAGANPCADSDTYCIGGDSNGQPCGGDDSKCSGGVCDACTVTGGVTTEDEMFILLGNYYVMPPSP